MFDPFNPGASPFSNAFEGGGYRAFAGREDQMERQKLALERAREKKRELLENERKQGEKMAKEYKVPYQPKDWVSSAANAASTALGIAKEQGLFQPKTDNTRSIETTFNMSRRNEVPQAVRDVTSDFLNRPSSSWGFDPSKAFNP